MIKLQHSLLPILFPVNNRTRWWIRHRSSFPSIEEKIVIEIQLLLSFVTFKRESLLFSPLLSIIDQSNIYLRFGNQTMFHLRLILLHLHQLKWTANRRGFQTINSRCTHNKFTPTYPPRVAFVFISVFDRCKINCRSPNNNRSDPLLIEIYRFAIYDPLCLHSPQMQ